MHYHLYKDGYGHYVFEPGEQARFTPVGKPDWLITAMEERLTPGNKSEMTCRIISEIIPGGHQVDIVSVVRYDPRNPQELRVDRYTIAFAGRVFYNVLGVHLSP